MKCLPLPGSNWTNLAVLCLKSNPAIADTSWTLKLKEKLNTIKGALDTPNMVQYPIAKSILMRMKKYLPHYFISHLYSNKRRLRTLSCSYQFNGKRSSTFTDPIAYFCQFYTGPFYLKTGEKTEVKTHTWTYSYHKDLVAITKILKCSQLINTFHVMKKKIEKEHLLPQIVWKIHKSMFLGLHLSPKCRTDSYSNPGYTNPSPGAICSTQAQGEPILLEHMLAHNC